MLALVNGFVTNRITQVNGAAAFAGSGGVTG
jgi:hypothetical protein